MSRDEVAQRVQSFVDRAQSLFEAGRYDEGAHVAATALQVAESELGTADPEYVRCLHNLSVLEIGGSTSSRDCLTHM
jgi:hypothetical protein